eukprot:TRINITY_DN4648_c0_g1_i1.p1 TRINITY_DN4648_c0_g1~~TRINITY_DN4648_c0_g1_i1.p1  ORF type:complete len:591 (+),score=170.74 TRINITY_DN4648_c0_g1_i1:44-1816(+)
MSEQDIPCKLPLNVLRERTNGFQETPEKIETIFDFRILNDSIYIQLTHETNYEFLYYTTITKESYSEMQKLHRLTKSFDQLPYVLPELIEKIVNNIDNLESCLTLNKDSIKFSIFQVQEYAKVTLFESKMLLGDDKHIKICLMDRLKVFVKLYEILSENYDRELLNTSELRKTANLLEEKRSEVAKEKEEIEMTNMRLLENLNKEHCEEKAKLINEIAELKVRIGSLEKINNEQDISIKMLAKDKQIDKEQLNLQQINSRESQDKINQLENNVEKLRANIKQLEDTLREKDLIINSLQSTGLTSQNDLRMVNIENDKLTTSNNNLKTRIDELEKIKEKLKQENQKFNDDRISSLIQINELSNNMNEKDLRINELSNEVIKLSDVLNELQTSLSVKENDILSLKKTLEGELFKNKSLSVQITELQENIEQLVYERDRYKERCDYQLTNKRIFKAPNNLSSNSQQIPISILNKNKDDSQQLQLQANSEKMPNQNSSPQSSPTQNFTRYLNTEPVVPMNPLTNPISSTPKLSTTVNTYSPPNKFKQTNLMEIAEANQNSRSHLRQFQNESIRRINSGNNALKQQFSASNMNWK